MVPGERAPAARHAPLRRPAHGRHGAPRGHDRRDGHRRGQDARRDAARATSTRCTGRGVHIVTVNDYLADATPQWMGPIYHALGLAVGVIQHEASFLYDPAYVAVRHPAAALRPCQRREAYRADITYGTNNEFGFDYLRDNMRFSLEELVQRELHYAIVDEVDSILIDEARTPLIISGPTDESRPTSTTRSTGSSPSSSGRPPSRRASSPRSRRPAGRLHRRREGADGRR